MKRFITHFFIITLFTMVTYGQSGIKKPDWKEKNLVGKVKKMKEKMVFFDDKKQYVAFAKGEGSPSDIENVSITYVFNQRGYIESFISENGIKFLLSMIIGIEQLLKFTKRNLVLLLWRLFVSLTL